LSKQLDYPKGDPRNPLSDTEIEEKFAALADGVMSRPRQQQVRDAIWNLEKCNAVTELMELLKAEKSTAAGS
jgi:2-methylcitrate dehydratase